MASECTAKDCVAPALAKHYQRFRKYGDANFRVRATWGTGCINKDGYRVIGMDGKLLREHRIVMERVLGRALLPTENVHHKNGDRADNRPENLELWSTNQPSGQKVEDKTAWAVEWLRQYAPELLK